MFVKFRKDTGRESVSDRHGNPNAKVVPYREYIYEVDSVHYEKFPMAELDDAVKEIGIYTPIFGELDDEFFFVVLERHDEAPEYVVAASCSMFIMSNDGKTIDAISCV